MTRVSTIRRTRWIDLGSPTSVCPVDGTAKAAEVGTADEPGPVAAVVGTGDGATEEGDVASTWAGIAADGEAAAAAKAGADSTVAKVGPTASAATIASAAPTPVRLLRFMGC